MYQSEYENGGVSAGFTIPELKAEARENLLGHYSVLIWSLLLLSLIQSLVGQIFANNVNTGAGISQYIIYYAAMLIISTLYLFFETGIYSMHLKVSRKQMISFNDLSFAIKNRSNRFLIAALFLSAVSYLFQIPFNLLVNYGLNYGLNQLTASGIMDLGTVELPGFSFIRNLAVVCAVGFVIYFYLNISFSLVLFLLIDNPQMEAKEAIAKSWRLMSRKRKKLFLLYLSYIGLYLLGLLTFTIANLWVTPYLTQSITLFYKETAGAE